MRRLLIPSIAALALAVPGVALATVRELGYPSDAPFPKPSCRSDGKGDCEVVGRLTGYQTRIGSHAEPFRAPHDGKIVALTIRLSSPTSKQIKFFDESFGGPPRARLSVLRPLKGGRMQLRDQSEVFDLLPYLGSTPSFALERPLRIRKGYTLALTVPTWAPAFGIGLPKTSTWRSDRPAGHCADIAHQYAQQTVKGIRKYPCGYTTARLLYRGTFVSDPTRTHK